MADDRHLLRDIRLDLDRPDPRSTYSVVIERSPMPKARPTGRPRESLDMALVSGRDNLRQAVLVRLLTPRGELAALGHPSYGSRLHELIGEVNNESTRNLARLYILESLQMEPRIEKVQEIKVEPAPGYRDLVSVLLAVKPVGQTGIVTIGPFTLELEP